MKNNIIRGHGFKKLLAVFLCALFVLTLFPMTAFAWPVDGNPASSWYGDNVVGSDGATYNHPAPWSYMRYNSDGTTSYGSYNGGTPYRHFVLADASGASRWVYCVESGVNFGDSSGGYSPSGENSAYMNLLPSSAQHGIKIAALYGWQPGAVLPISGINENDWYMATQCIIWEYQQQVRSDPHSRHNNGPVSANQYYSVIAGRPAERAYNYVLGKIATHSTIPSFTGSSAGSAPVHELKWDTVDKVYRLTLTDTNNLNIDLITLSGHPGVTITRSGNRYTITSTKMIMDPVTFQFRKNVPEHGGILIWGRPGFQTMMTGAQDPVTFFAKIKTETYGWARLIKTSEDGIVEGIRFNISGTDVLGQKVNVDVTTGAGGRVDAKLLPGTYLVKEYPIDRYVTPAPQYVTIESAQISEVHFTNILKKFRVLLTKTDADTGIAQGDASLAGAQYGLYKGNELVDIYTTDANGQFLTRYYVCGTDWTIRELVPSTGYLLDEKVHPVGADPRLYEVELNTTENHVTEKVIYGNIRLIKHTDDWDEDIAEDERPAEGEDGNVGMIEQPEAGAVFEIYLRSAGSYANAKPSERDILTTDADGIAVSKMLPYGRYTVHQVAAGPAGENKAFVPDFTVFICHDQYTYSYILNNDAITGRVRIEKRDAETGKIIPIAGTGFRIKDLDTGEFIAQTVWYPNPITIDLFYTSDEGWLMLPDPLPKNTNGYLLFEEYAPYGYVLGNGEGIHFAIDGSEAIVTVVQENMPQKGTITITKTGEVFASVEENDGLYLPVYEVMGLPGAVYDIIADEDITTGDGTVRVPKDTVVETLTTGEDATATSGLLYLGRYRLEERQSPYGMVLDPEPIFVELTYAGQDVEVTQTAVGIYDERQKVAIDLLKSMEIDELFDIGLNEEYKGVSFGLYAAHDIVALDGSVIPADGLLEVVSIEPVEGEPGRYAAAFAADLPFATFYVQERTTSKEYILNDTQYPVVFAYAGQDIAVVSITANDGEAIENDLLRGDIEGIKRGEDPDGGEPFGLGGAKLGLFHPDDEDMTEETALLTTVSADDGSFSFTGIPFGHWVVKEYESPALYSISTEYHHVYVGVDGQIIEIRVDNTLIRGSVQLYKTEAVDEPGAVENENDNPFMRRLPGAVFEIHEDTNANGEFDEGDTLLGELEETDAGFHQKTGLLESGYFIKEKVAPTGCILDENAYYFAITEDGQTVVVENGEAGQGFVNEAYRGNLRIVKDSSDGRKDGFAFEVKSADGAYSETFTSGSTGIIEVTGLRAGKYTVTELSNRASRDYIIPDGATIEIKADETAVVQFFNEKKLEPEKPTTPTTPSTPSNPTPSEPLKPVPQTSDDNMLIVWIAMLGVAAIGSTVSIVLYVKGRKSKGKRRTGSTVALLLCVALLAGSGFMLMQEAGQYTESAGVYDKLAEFVDKAEPQQEETQEGEAAPAASRLPAIDFDALLEVNPDIRAWLLCEDTAINYPVVKGEDNAYYLKHLYDGTQNKAGCLFIDYENDPFTDRNTIIYGHNLLDGSMFSELTQYQEQAYYDAHPDMLLATPDGGYIVEVFAAFVVSPKEAGSETSPWHIQWEDNAAFGEWLTATQARSLFQTDVTVQSSDQVLTLSTCINRGADRFIVMGKLTPTT